MENKPEAEARTEAELELGAGKYNRGGSMTEHKRSGSGNKPRRKHGRKHKGAEIQPEARGSTDGSTTGSGSEIQPGRKHQRKHSWSSSGKRS